MILYAMFKLDRFSESVSIITNPNMIFSCISCYFKLCSIK